MTYNRSEIMKSAWTIYRETYTLFGVCRYDRRNFAWALTEAWRRAKEARRIAAVPADRKVAVLASIDRQIADLKYSSFRTNTIAVRRDLEAQRAALAA